MSPVHTPRAELEAGTAALGLKLDVTSIERLLAYLDELAKWNAAYNLTAVRQPLEMVTRHLLDSLVVLPLVRGPMLDVGSGAGLPGLPLAMVDAGLKVDVLDSNGKKARFLRHAVRALQLENVKVIDARAEAWRPEMPYACVISRAFARLPDFLALTAHLATNDGQWLAMKGKLDPQELAEVPEGFRIVDVKPLQVPGLPEARHLIVVARLPESRVRRKYASGPECRSS